MSIKCVDNVAVTSVKPEILRAWVINVALKWSNAKNANIPSTPKMYNPTARQERRRRRRRRQQWQKKNFFNFNICLLTCYREKLKMWNKTSKIPIYFFFEIGESFIDWIEREKQAFNQIFQINGAPSMCKELNLSWTLIRHQLTVTHIRVSWIWP